MKSRMLLALWWLLPLGLWLPLATGCTHEAWTDCPQPVELWLRVVDIEGEDITGQGAVKSLSLYIFDHRKEFLRRLDARTGEPAHLYFPDQDTLYVVSWGNLTAAHQRLPTLDPGTPLHQAMVQLHPLPQDKAAGSAPDRTACPLADTPDDLFYSFDELSLKPGGQSLYQLQIDRVVGSMCITLRHLQNYANHYDEDYSLVVRETYDAIDFYGRLTGGKVGYRPAARFNANKELIAPLFNLFPSHPQGVIEIDIYHGGTLVTTVAKDSRGQPLRVLRGQVLNVLVDFRLQVDVQVSLTPWGTTEISKEF